MYILQKKNIYIYIFTVYFKISGLFYNYIIHVQLKLSTVYI